MEDLLESKLGLPRSLRRDGRTLMSSETEKVSVEPIVSPLVESVPVDMWGSSAAFRRVDLDLKVKGQCRGRERARR